MKKNSGKKAIFIKIGILIALVMCMAVPPAVYSVSSYGDGFGFVFSIFLSVLGVSFAFGLTNAKPMFKFTLPIATIIAYVLSWFFFDFWGWDVAGLVLYLLAFFIVSTLGVSLGHLINFIVKLIIRKARKNTKTDYAKEKQIVDKTYRRHTIKLVSILICFSILGCSILTLQKANWVIRDICGQLESKQQNFYNGIENYCGCSKANSGEMNPYWENPLGIIPAFYLAHGDAVEDPFFSEDVGFYSMLSNLEGETVAFYQPCILFEKNVNDAKKHDARVLVLGDEFVEEYSESYSSDEFFSAEDAIYFFSNCSLYGREHLGEEVNSLEVVGTCDENFVYIKNLSWFACAFFEEFTYLPQNNQTDKGNMDFNDWFGYENGDYKISIQAFSHKDSWNAEYIQEAKEICEKGVVSFNGVSDTHFENSSNGLMTYTVRMTDGIVDCNDKDNYIYSCAYVFHPLRMAIAELFYVYIAILIFAIIAIVIMAIIMKKNYEKQQAAENNRRDLTRGIAHELKTPLAITRGYVENWEYLPEEEKEEITKTMMSEMDHMNKMVTDLLELSHMEAGIKTVQWEEVDLYSLTSSILKRMKNIISERDLNVKLIPEAVENADAFVAEADLEMIRIAMSNFISNAVKYAEKEVTVTLTQSSKKVRFEIENDGSTIDSEEIKKVWDEFYKSDSVNRSTIGSSGLGLAITKNIFILHNAEYGCNSENGKIKFFFEIKKEK